MKFINSNNLSDALSAFRTKCDAAYAAKSHGTHVSYGGNGSASTVSRSDHTHNYAGSSSAGGAATSANKVNTNLAIKLNGGTTEGTNLFTFNGSTAKTINITPSAIGAAASSHGTHVTYSTTSPKVAGTAAVGTESSVARGDHVHAAQTSVSGNAGSATKLATARNITIGNKANSFNGTAAITYTVDDIGAVKGQFKTATTAATAQWYRVAQSPAGINRVAGLFFIESTVSGKHSITTLSVGINYGVNPYVQQLSHSAYSATGISKARIVYHTSYNNNYAYLEVYQTSATAATMNVRLIEGMGWTLIAPNTVGSIPSGYTNKEITLVNNAIVSNVTGSLSGNASTATKATQDSAGQQINTTYIKGLSVSGKTITYTKGDGTTGTITTQDTNTTYSQATSSALGLVKLYTSTGTATDGTMTQAAINTALNGKANSSHGTHVPTPQTASNTKFLRNDNTWQDVTAANIGAATAGQLTVTNANIGTLSNLETSAKNSLVDATNELYQSLSSHGPHLTIGTGASNAAAGNHTHDYAASSHKHGLLHDNHTVEIANTTTDSGWSMINSSYNNGFILKSVRTSANAPNWICNSYAAGIAFGGGDTKGVLSCAYNSPSIKIAGGNGTKPVWWVSLTGTSGTAYDLNRINTAYTHSQAAHAPSNAQKNSDITKAEIEAKLTGAITSHSHTTVNGFTFWSGTQDQYDAISNKDANTIYMITE